MNGAFASVITKSRAASGRKASLNQTPCNQAERAGPRTIASAGCAMTEALLRDILPTGAASEAATADIYARIIEASPSGLLQVTATGTIRLVNCRIEQTFGYDRSELLGRSVDMLLPERFRAGHGALRARFLASSSARAMGADRDIVAMRKDGSEFPVEIGLNPVTVDGQVSVIAAVQDITVRAQARRELERSNADLAEFAHAASHDLKSPLRGIAHLAEWIEEDIAGIAPSQALENLARLRARAARMTALLDGLLAYAQVGRTHVDIETFDTGRMIQDLIATLSLPDGFIVTLDGDMPTITSDRIPLERVLQNLIENAVKHHDRAAGRVTIGARREGKRVRFTVADDGPGIQPRHHELIFQMFRTLARRDAVEGNGIGLAIVKKKVEMHGGEITVKSAPPARGTTFTFTWPAMEHL